MKIITLAVALLLFEVASTERISYKLEPPALTYNKTSKLTFMFDTAVKCPLEQFLLFQVPKDGSAPISWKAGVNGSYWLDNSNFVIPKAVFYDWGNYSNMCIQDSTSYSPSPMFVPVQVNPRIFKANLTLEIDEEIALPTTTPMWTNETDNSTGQLQPFDDSGPSSFDFSLPLSMQGDSRLTTWLLKFDVGDGCYAGDEVGKFNLTGLNITSVRKRNGHRYLETTEKYDVPWDNYPEGKTYRYTFDMSIESALNRPSVCDIPLEAAVGMESNLAQSRHAINVTLHLEYEPQQMSASARVEGSGCVLRCAIRSACPLVDSLEMSIQAGSSQLPSASAQQATFVEAKIWESACQTLVQLARNQTGTFTCTAKNHVGTTTLSIGVHEIPGISYLEDDLDELPGSALPLWAKIAIPVGCLVSIVLFVLVICLSCKYCKKNKELENVKKTTNHQTAQEQPPPEDNQPTPAETSTRNGNYRGPVAQHGQTYQMPQQERVMEELPQTRVLPPATQPNDSWQGSFSDVSSWTASSVAAPQPRLGGPSQAVMLGATSHMAPKPPGVAPPKPPHTTTQQLATSSSRPPQTYTYGNANAAYEMREQGFAKANREAAARYLPAEASPQMGRRQNYNNSPSNGSGSFVV